MLDLDRPPLGGAEHPTALWITHTQYRPELVSLAPGAGVDELPATVELAPAEPARVRVVDGRGAPVEGATVRQLAAVPPNALADLLEPQAARVLERVVVTGSDGWVTAAAWSGPMLLVASLDGRASEVWTGDPRPSVELTLRETFVVSGTVAFRAGDDIHGPPRVLCSARRGTLDALQVTLPVVDGAFGPAEIALGDAEQFAFRLEGFNVEVEVQRIDPPEPGSAVRIDFEGRAGLDLWTRIIDPAGDPVPGTESIASWEAGGERVEVVSHTAVEPGYFPNRGVPPGAVTLSARAPGYVGTVHGPTEVPVDPPVTYVLVLKPGRLIRGRVTAAGEPVEDFDVTFWSGAPERTQTQSFRSRQGGAFELWAEALADVLLIAKAPGFGPSGTVVSTPTGVGPLELSLTELVEGRGKVVDAANGDPLSGVEIQPFAVDDRSAVVPFGVPVWSGLDGSFRARAFGAGRSRTRFTKEGYSTHWAETSGAPGAELDFASIALAARQPLTFRLVSDREIDPRSYTLSSNGQVIGDRAFTADGTIRIESASAGEYRLRVVAPDGRYWTQTVRLDPGETWDVELPAASDRTLRVHYDTGDFSPEQVFTTAILPTLGVHSREVVLGIPDGREVVFDAPAPGAYEVTMRSLGGEPLGVASGRIPDDGPIPDAHVGVGIPTHRFRIVDAEGEAVVGGELAVLDAGTWAGGLARTDERGEATITGLEPGEYRARVVHPTLGMQFGIPVTVTASMPEVTELRIDPSLGIEVQVVDGALPLAGVQCRLWEEQRMYVLPSRTTDAQGRLTWERLGRGGFVLEASHSEVWSTEVHVEAAAPDTVAEVQVRRTGTLVLELRDALGGPLKSVPIELTSLEFGASVAEWIAAERVSSSTGALASDDSGGLTLTGLPRGPYAWSLNGVEGTLDVVARVRTIERLTVP